MAVELRLRPRGCCSRPISAATRTVLEIPPAGPNLVRSVGPSRPIWGYSRIQSSIRLARSWLDWTEPTLALG